MTGEVYMTGCHSVLVKQLTEEQRQGTIAQLGDTYVTDGHYRLMAYLDERAQPWASEGTYTIWHMALENEDERINDGIYASGLLIETTSIRFLRDLSNMTLKTSS